MTEYNKNLRKQCLDNNRSLFFFLLYALGGIIRLGDIYLLLGGRNRTSDRLLLDMQRLSLIKLKRVHNRKIVLLKSAVFEYFGIAPKLKFNDNTLNKAILFFKVYTDNYGMDIERLRKEVDNGNFAWYKPENSYYLMNRVYNYVKQGNDKVDLSCLKLNVDLLKRKTDFLTTFRKGSREKLSAEDNPIKIEDLHTLKCKSIFVQSVDYKSDTLFLKVIVFISDKKNKTKIETKAIQELKQIFYPLKIFVNIQTYSVTMEREPIRLS